MIWAAVIIVVAQGLIIALGLYLVRTFGAYTDALETVHQENLVLRQHLANSLSEVRDLYLELRNREVA